MARPSLFGVAEFSLVFPGTRLGAPWLFISSWFFTCLLLSNVLKHSRKSSISDRRLCQAWLELNGPYETPSTYPGTPVCTCTCTDQTYSMGTSAIGYAEEEGTAYNWI